MPVKVAEEEIFQPNSTILGQSQEKGSQKGKGMVAQQHL